MSLHLRLLTACLISLSALAPYARGDAAALLRAVPQGTSTVVWIRDLRELSDDLDRLAASLTNAAAPPKEVLARALARRVEAGFTSDEELKSLGFDTSQGIAFALERDGSFTAVIRVSDASRAQSRLSRGGPASLTHDGVSYFASPGRSFAFVDDLLVYSTAADGVPRAIDALRGRTPSSRVPSVDSTADVVVLAAREQTAAARTDLLGALGIGDGGRDAASIASSSLGLVGFLSALFGGSQAPQAVLSASVGRDDVRVRVGDGDLPALGTSAWRAMPNDAFAAGSLFVGPGAQGELDAVAKALAAVMPRFAGVPDGSPREIAFAARVRRYLLPEVVCAAPLAGGAAEPILSGVLRAVVGTLSPDAPASDIAAARRQKMRWCEADGWTFPLVPRLLTESVPGARRLLPERLGVWYTTQDGELLWCVAETPDPLDWLLRARRRGETLAGSAEPSEPASSYVVVSPYQYLKQVSAASAPALPQAQALSVLLKDGSGRHTITVARSEGRRELVIADVASLKPLLTAIDAYADLR